MNYKITIYDINDEVLVDFIKINDRRDIDNLYSRVAKTFGFHKPYKTIQNKVYCYIDFFECYGRFKIKII